MLKTLRILFIGLLIAATAPAQTITHVDDYQGIWFDLGQYSNYGPKYSGGLGTYTAKHVPLAIYSSACNKTFFVYGGTIPGERHLLAMIGAYDHAKKTFSEPVVVHDKQGVDDPHDDPSISMDDDGFIWVFVSGRGHTRPGFIYKSRKPYSIQGFDQILKDEFTYPQPWWVPGKGFLHLFTKYVDTELPNHKTRDLYWSTSPDGVNWSPPQKLAGMDGHYQTSCARGNKVVTAFNVHPGHNNDKRTNLYYMQTQDMGKTWTTVDGKVLSTPQTDIHSPALVHDYQSEGLLVYMKDINFDDRDNPVILYLTSRGHQPGPSGGQRTWWTAHWTGSEWDINPITVSTHNYDMGSIHIKGNTWRLVAPTETGPQSFGAGGEIAIWESKDQGANWSLINKVTQNSPYNHNYIRRPVNAQPDFYAFWADGDPFQFSPSHLYKMTREGQVTRIKAP